MAGWIFFVSMTGLGLDLSAKNNLFDRIGRPLVSIYLDPLVGYADQVCIPIRRRIVTTVSDCDLDYWRAAAPGIAIRHLPHAAEPAPSRPWAERDISLLFSATGCENPERMRENWSRHGESVSKGLNSHSRSLFARTAATLDRRNRRGSRRASRRQESLCDPSLFRNLGYLSTRARAMAVFGSAERASRDCGRKRMGGVCGPPYRLWFSIRRSTTGNRGPEPDGPDQDRAQHLHRVSWNPRAGFRRPSRGRGGGDNADAMVSRPCVREYDHPTRRRWSRGRTRSTARPGSRCGKDRRWRLGVAGAASHLDAPCPRHSHLGRGKLNAKAAAGNGLAAPLLIIFHFKIPADMPDIREAGLFSALVP